MKPSPDFITSYGVLAEKLGNAQTRDDIAEVLFEFIEQNVPMPFLGVYLYDAEQQKLLNVKCKGFTDAQRIKAEESVMDRHPGKAFRENRVLWIPDTHDNTADQHVASPRDFEVRSALVIPVCSDEKAIGVLTMASDKVRYFSEQMRDIMCSACNITGIAYRNIMRMQEQRSLMTELLKAKREAELANSEKSLFLANVSHELRTPIHGIRGLIDLTHKAQDPVQKDSYISFASQSLEQLENVVGDLLDISMSQGGRLLLKDEWFSLEDVLPGLMTEFSNQASSKGLTFHTEMPEALGMEVNADPTRLRQALSILLNNAIKYTPSGHVTFTGAWAVSNETKELTLAVEDTGMGISEEELPLIFNPFFRSYNQEKNNLKGTGLGLVVCKEIVECLGGNINATSKPGKGSRFEIHLSLPCRPKIPAADMARGARTHYDLKGRRILVAEDSEVNQLVLASILESFGVELFMVSNGEQAWQTLRATQVDLIIMDLQMPSMNGIDAMIAIRADGNSTPAIALTANSDQLERERCLQVGFNEYVCKPFETTAMQAMMGRLLEEDQVRS